jgi:1-acyl-sn-glycerol-3-phosphate acyltransferase
MLNILVVAAILVLFACYDILLGLSRLLAPALAFETAERLARGSVKRIFRLMRSYCRVSLVFENRSGSELPERFLLVANHQSLLDIPLSIALFPGHRLRFVAKRELGDGIPFVSLLLKSQGHALVRRRGEAAETMRAIRRFARRCERESTCPVIFPEGTRSRDGSVGVFHTAGVRKILGETALPVVIAAYDGLWRVASMRGVILGLRAARFRVRVLSVTWPLRGKKEVLEAIGSAREKILSGLAEMAAEEGRQGGQEG